MGPKQKKAGGKEGGSGGKEKGEKGAGAVVRETSRELAKELGRVGGQAGGRRLRSVSTVQPEHSCTAVHDSKQAIKRWRPCARPLPGRRRPAVPTGFCCASA